MAKEYDLILEVNRMAEDLRFKKVSPRFAKINILNDSGKLMLDIYHNGNFTTTLYIDATVMSARDIHTFES